MVTVNLVPSACQSDSHSLHGCSFLSLCGNWLVWFHVNTGWGWSCDFWDYLVFAHPLGIETLLTLQQLSSIHTCLSNLFKVHLRWNPHRAASRSLQILLRRRNHTVTNLTWAFWCRTWRALAIEERLGYEIFFLEGSYACSPVPLETCAGSLTHQPLIRTVNELDLPLSCLGILLPDTLYHVACREKEEFVSSAFLTIRLPRFSNWHRCLWLTVSAGRVLKLVNSSS